MCVFLYVVSHDGDDDHVFPHRECFVYWCGGGGGSRREERCHVLCAGAENNASIVAVARRVNQAKGKERG